MKKLLLSLFFVLLIVTVVTAVITQTGDNLDVPGNITGVDTILTSIPVHCHSYRTTTLTIPNAGAYLGIIFDTNTDCNYITTDNENFTIGITGDYHVSVDFMADKTAGGVVLLEAVLLKNGNEIVGTASQRVVNSNNEIGFFAINSNINLVANDVLSVGIISNAANARLNMDCIVCAVNVTAKISIARET